VKLARDDPTVAGRGGPSVADGVVQVEERPDLLAVVGGVDEDGTALQQVAVAL
jgi:hypothetical protein